MYATLANPYKKNSRLFCEYEIHLARSARKIVLSLQSIGWKQKVIMLDFLDAQIDYWMYNNVQEKRNRT